MESPRERLTRENNETIRELKLAEPKTRKEAIEREILNHWYRSCFWGHKSCEKCADKIVCDQLRKRMGIKGVV